MIGKLVPIRNGEKKPKTDDISIMLNAVLQRKKKKNKECRTLNNESHYLVYARTCHPDQFLTQNI